MKLSKSKQLELLDNDVAVLEMMFANQDGVWLTFPGEYMPDGEPFKVSLEGVKEMTGELRQSLVQTVRSQYDARETEQNAAKVRDENPPAADNGGADTGPRDGGAGVVPTSPPVQEPEAGILETLAARKKDLLGKLGDAEHEYNYWNGLCADLSAKITEIEICINALQAASPATSESSGPSSERKAPRSGSKRGSQKGSRRKTTSKSNKN